MATPLQHILVPLYTRPHLIGITADVIRTVWPCCKAERLRRIVAEDGGSALPCSLVLIENPGTSSEQVIGYLRLVTVTRPESPRSAYGEAVTLIGSKQGQGLGRKLLTDARVYGAEKFGCMQFFGFSHADKKPFYEYLSYKEVPAHSFETVGANLLPAEEQISSWYRNQAPSWWESAYDWGHVATKEEMEKRVFGLIPMMLCLDKP